MTRLLGGDASPIGWSVQFVDAPCAITLAALLDGSREVTVTVSSPQPYPDVLNALTPFEAPWTRELLLPCGAWTAYLNNFVDGGDSSAAAAWVARRMGVRHVAAEHSPRHGPGHGSTQLWLSGPDGTPPLMAIRTVSAVATDGRWGWYESGSPLPFEEIDRYRARRIRDRFDRELLLRYLDALGIPARDETAYGAGVIVQQQVTGTRRTVTLDEARAELLHD